MKNLTKVGLALLLSLMLCACGKGEKGVTSNPKTSPNASEQKQEQTQEGRGDLIEVAVPEGADVIRQGVFYYKLVEMPGDYGEGLSPREGAELTDDLLTSIGLYSDNGGILPGWCVYISLDELAVLDSAMGRECYIYSVGLGTAKGGLMGNDYQVIYRISVDYSGKKTASLYEDFSSGYKGEGRGDIIGGQ